MEPLFNFITSTGGLITSAIVATLVVIIIISYIDRHPTGKDPAEKIHKEPRPDDE